MSPGDTVRTFIAALVRKDLDSALELVTDDIEYDNVPIGKALGREAAAGVLGPFLGGCAEVDWVIHHQVEQGDVVMNERTDRFRLGDRWVELPVAGLFVLRDGRIALWRDYFDDATFRAMLAG